MRRGDGGANGALLAMAALGFASSIGHAGPPAIDFSAHDGAPTLEQKNEGVRRELVTKFPIGSPVADIVEALQRWGSRSGGFCRLRTDVTNTYYCERAHVFAPNPVLAANWVVSITFDPATQTATEYRVHPGTNIFLPELPLDARERLSR